MKQIKIYDFEALSQGVWKLFRYESASETWEEVRQKLDAEYGESNWKLIEVRTDLG